MADVLAVDIDGVIIDSSSRGTHRSRMHGSFDGLRRLVDKRFHDKVFLLSEGGVVEQKRILEWLKYQHFFVETGIKEKNVFYCCSHQEKAGIAKKLGVTCAVDDRLEVLDYYHGVGVPNLYLFCPDKREVVSYQQYFSLVKQVDSWSELVRGLLV